MSSYDKVKMELPNGDTFVGVGNLSVTENHQPFYLLDGFQTLRTLGEQLGVVENDTAQAFLGSGARVRTWTVEFTNWEGNSESWGSAAADDDVITKLNVLGQSLATAGIDGRNPVTFSYGEYSPAGQFSPQSVVPGEISLPADLSQDGSASTFRPSLTWRDA
ncbi:MAG: hypothetical protein V5A27_03725, partial [Halapricum sp.]